MPMTLDGKTPAETSIAILREFEPPEGYDLEFSGGKDSCVLMRLADMAGVKYDAHYRMTTIDPPELTRFILREHPDVQWEVPPWNFFEGIRRKGLPGRTTRWCCADFKEVGGDGRKVLLGLRAAESATRAKRGVVQACHQQRKWFVSPLMAWTDADVWEFIRAEGIPYCRLYDEGFHRLGCVLCPFEKHPEVSMARWPVFWRLAREAAVDYYARSAACQARWATGDEYFEWWASRTDAYPDPDAERPPTLPFEETAPDA